MRLNTAVDAVCVCRCRCILRRRSHLKTPSKGGTLAIRQEGEHGGLNVQVQCEEQGRRYLPDVTVRDIVVGGASACDRDGEGRKDGGDELDAHDERVRRINECDELCSARK